VASVEDLLTEARQLGFLGPGPVEPHIAHAAAYVAATTRSDPALVVDLGSGGGLPALVLLANGFGRRWVLVERSRTRADWLRRATRRLGAADQVDILCMSAEAVSRTELRASADLVTARSFAPLAITAEVAAPLLRQGGELVVSIEATQVMPSRIEGLSLNLERREVGGYLFCRGELFAEVAQSAPRTWRSMQRAPAF